MWSRSRTFTPAPAPTKKYRLRNTGCGYVSTKAVDPDSHGSIFRLDPQQHDYVFNVFVKWTLYFRSPAQQVEKPASNRSRIGRWEPGSCFFSNSCCSNSCRLATTAMINVPTNNNNIPSQLVRTERQSATLNTHNNNNNCIFFFVSFSTFPLPPPCMQGWVTFVCDL